MLLGEANMQKLYASKIAVFGVGGVGGFCVEALARSGIGHIDVFDNDRVCITNINRQIIATHKTVGLYKADVMRERVLEINPTAQVGAYRLFYSPETADTVDLSRYDYIVDAIDTMTAKLELICRANACAVPVISSMGAANKLDASAFMVADIYETSVCPMARVMRRELRKRDIAVLKVVYSKEPAMTPLVQDESGCGDCRACPPDEIRNGAGRRQVPASNAFVPPVAGLIMAGEVVKDLTGVTPDPQ